MANHSGNQGSTLLYVVLLTALLAVLSAGYLALGRLHGKAAGADRDYWEALAAARSIHRSFCEAVRDGKSAAMEQVEEQIQKGEVEYCRTYGTGVSPDGSLQAKITLTVSPEEELAQICTTVSRRGYTISLNADILLEESGGLIFYYENSDR